MKRIIPILAAACLGLVLGAGPSWAAMFECVRPDGSVIGTVNTNQEPSVVCNHDYRDCNLVCKARAHLVREGYGTGIIVEEPMRSQGQIRSSTGGPAYQEESGTGMASEPRRTKKRVRSSTGGPSSTNPPESHPYCVSNYNRCKSDCRANPNNSSRYEMDACMSSCYSTFSGCGKRPSGPY